MKRYLGVSVSGSGSAPKNPEPGWIPGSRERGTRLTIHFFAFLNKMKYSHTLLLPFRTKLVWVPGSWERGTRPSSREPGTHTNFVRQGSRRVCEYFIVFKIA